MECRKGRDRGLSPALLAPALKSEARLFIGKKDGVLGALDLNTASAQATPSLPVPSPPQRDIETITHILRENAADWVPELFPRGRLDPNDKTLWRIANIRGEPPKKHGSCIVHMAGDKAGGWYDYEFGKGGEGPLSTIKEALGLTPAALMDHAVKLVERYASLPSAPQQLTNGHAKKDDGETELREAAHTLRHAGPIKGTLGETYLAARSLADPQSDDLLFNDNTTYRERGIAPTGQPALIARFRYPSGEPTGGIHRTYLAGDGSAHGPKKMLAPPGNGAVVMLGQPDTRGNLGIGEGIESTLAAMQLYHMTGGWACASDGGMKRFAQWLRANQQSVKTGSIKRLLVWADRKRAGIAAAGELVATAQEIGLPAVLCIPRSDDDFAKDLEFRLLPETAPDQEVLPPVSSTQRTRQAPAAILAAAKMLTRDYEATQVADIVRQLAIAGLDPIAKQQVLDTIAAKTRLKPRALEDMLRKEGGGSSLPATGDVRKAPPAWTDKIITGLDGEPARIAKNVLTALRGDDGWRGVLGLDEFRQRPMIMRPPPWGGCPEGTVYPRIFSDADEARTLIWMQEQGLHVRMDAVRQALSVVIDDNRFHPVRDYLSSLVWDKQPRLDRWLTYYLGVEEIEDYTRPVGACWMISAVARIFRPGCTAKYALILEGDQDLKKSTALEILGSPWFTDDIAELGTKDAAMQVGNAWIVELSELDSTRKAHISAIKSFISRKTDRFRKPFGRYVIEEPRQSVLAGTINPSTPYFVDDTGAVRFWPVICAKIDTEALQHDRDQLWAEAVVRYEAGEKWYLDNDEQLEAARQQQEQRYAADSWEATIEHWLKLNASWLTRTTTSEILQTVFEMAPRDHDRASQTRVGIAMRRIGRRLGWRADVTSNERPRPYVKDIENL